MLCHFSTRFPSCFTKKLRSTLPQLLEKGRFGALRRHEAVGRQKKSRSITFILLFSLLALLFEYGEGCTIIKPLGKWQLKKNCLGECVIRNSDYAGRFSDTFCKITLTPCWLLIYIWCTRAHTCTFALSNPWCSCCQLSAIFTHFGALNYHQAP